MSRAVTTLPPSVQALLDSAYDAKKTDRVLNRGDDTQHWRYLTHGNWGTVFRGQNFAPDQLRDEFGIEGAGERVVLKLPGFRRGKKTLAEIVEWETNQNLPKGFYRPMATLADEAVGFALLKSVRKHENIMQMHAHWAVPHPDFPRESEERLMQNVFVLESCEDHDALDKLLLRPNQNAIQKAVGTANNLLSSMFPSFGAKGSIKDDDVAFKAAQAERREAFRLADPDEHFVPVLRGVLAAVAHMEAHGLIHQDIKPGNLLYRSSACSLKLVDHALVDVIDEQRHGQGLLFSKGTALYMPPLDKSTFDATTGGLLDFTGRRRCAKDDAFAAALVALELLLPFEALDADELARLLFSGFDAKTVNMTMYRGALKAVKLFGWQNHRNKIQDFVLALGAWRARFLLRAELQDGKSPSDLLGLRNRLCEVAPPRQTSVGSLYHGFILMGDDEHFRRIVDGAHEDPISDMLAQRCPLVREVVREVVLPLLLLDKTRRLGAGEAVERIDAISSKLAGP